MITKKDLENATQRLTDVAARIDLGLRFEVEMGSGPQGSPYRLHEWSPNFTHARLTEIGRTRPMALRWIEGYEAALLTVERQLKARKPLCPTI